MITQKTTIIITQTTTIKSIIYTDRNMDENIYILTDATILQKIGSNIRSNRIDRQITQEQLALYADVAVSSIRNIEQGKNIALTTLVSILRALQMLEYLYPLIREKEQSPILLATQIGKQKQKQRVRARHNTNQQQKDSKW